MTRSTNRSLTSLAPSPRSSEGAAVNRLSARKSSSWYAVAAHSPPPSSAPATTPTTRNLSAIAAAPTAVGCQNQPHVGLNPLPPSSAHRKPSRCEAIPLHPQQNNRRKSRQINEVKEHV
jgi:hypothetical protein